MNIADFLNTVAPLIIILAGLGIMLGILSPWRALKIVGVSLIIIPLIIAVSIPILKELLSQANTPTEIALLIAIGFILLAFFLRLLLGKQIFFNIVGSFIYDVFKAVVLFVFKGFRKFFKSIF
jgi:hypothetical protein